jgi:TrmH family RNA methyltransferase
VIVTSRKNPLVKKLRALRTSSGRRRREGLSLIEGYKILELAVGSGSALDTVLYDSESSSGDEVDLIEQAAAAGATTRAVTPAVLSCVSARSGPLGCVAAVSVAETRLTQLRLSGNPLLMVAEALEKPGNLGSLARTASAAGADALIAVDSSTDVFAPAALHASLGAVFALPVVRCSSRQALAWMHDRGIAVVATSPAGRSAYYELDLARPLAVAVGNEYRGLSQPWLDAGTPARIPMTGTMNSLNATVAGGIVLFEAVRQRAVS